MFKPMRITSVGLLLIAFLVGAGCASGPPKTVKTVPADHFSEIKEFDIPIVVNDRVLDWVEFFQGAGRERFTRYLQRSRQYIPMMRRILKEHGLPIDLVYLAMIESGFNPHAYSRARATGTWQFIYRTGLRYGLRVDSWIDERRDPEKSTVAAAKYLKDLYDRFNDWYLAAAGYNAGEGKIDRAIRRYRTEDYWKLAEGKYLKRETKDYVPKLIAAALIAKDPEKYGFQDLVYEKPIEHEWVTIPTTTDLRVVARLAEVSYDEIRVLNPELLRWITPPTYPDYQLKVPKGTAGRFEERYALLSPAERLGEEVHRVQAREPLTGVATRYGLPVTLLAAVNDLPPKGTVRAGQEILIPYPPPAGELFKDPVYEGRRHRKGHGKRTVAAKRSGERGVVASPNGPVTVYEIQEGDTLWDIGRKYNVSTRQLKDWNNISRHRSLRPGKTLKIYTPAATPPPTGQAAGAVSSM